MIPQSLFGLIVQQTAKQAACSSFFVMALKAEEIMGKNPRIHLKNMGHGADAKFHGFHEDISMLFMLAWDRKIVRNPHESMGSMGYTSKTMENHGKHGKHENLQK